MFKINNKNIQKIKYFSLGLITGSLLFTSVAFANNSDIKIYLNGKLLENAEVINVNNSTYLPVRKLCEALKMKVNFDSANNSVIIDSSINDNLIPINNNQKESNNIEILKDYKNMTNIYAIKINNIVYIPVQYVIKYYNVNCEKYDELSKIVKLYYIMIKL